MINSVLSSKIIHNFRYKLTKDQFFALEKMVDFLCFTEAESLFVLKGYAGTGKTSFIAAIVKTLQEFNQKTVLMAPTGRAAKVFSNYAGQPAFTIHKKIYRQKAYSNEYINFQAAENLHTNTIFIVDEASMIADEVIDSAQFGSGRLLEDLIEYVYSGEHCRLILVGDEAQLPPVKQTKSPALNLPTLARYGLTVETATLTQIVRQEEDSGILYNATHIREALRLNDIHAFPKISFQGFSDIRKVTGNELIEEIESAYNRDGLDETIVITRSNKRAVIYNNGIRNRILYREEELSSGDRLMVAKNNYFWTLNNKEIGFIANGEIVQVLRVRKTIELYGFRFADVTVRFIDYDVEMDLKILLDTLQTETAALPQELNERLFYSVLEDYSTITTKAEKMKKMKTDPYYNAVQVKYAYAVTCHKAQGGQWRNVFLDIGYVTEEMLGEDFYRWLYTAFTRSTDRLYLVNMPDEFEK